VRSPPGRPTTTDRPPAGSPSTERHPPTFNRRTATITVVVAIVLALGTVALIGHVADYHRIGTAVREADKIWFPLCLLGEFAAYAGYILAYRDLARVGGGPELPFRMVTRIVLIGFGATVAGASAGGLAVDFWALHRAGAPIHEAARRVLALNTLEWAVLSLAATAAGVLTLVGVSDGAPTAMALGWTVVTPVCILAAAWISGGSRCERFSALPEGDASLSRHPSSWWPWLRLAAKRGFADAIGGLVLLRTVLRRPRRYAAGLAGYPIYWFGDVLCLYAALRAFDVSPDVGALLLAYTTAYVATALPLPAGGAGGIEASLALSLSAIGVPLAAAILATVVYRIITFWLPILPALLALPGARRLTEELPDVPRAA
jgi:uncharacterized membrane protein YbhN (UPF0104 family)